jgi:hypothetical protein
MGTRHPEYERAAADWYIEPDWSVSALLNHLPAVGRLHDPCCGIGTIVDTARLRGITASGADIVDRVNGRFPVRDFLADDSSYPNIVTNPPYRPAVKIIRHALLHVPPNGRVATLVPIGFLASQQRHSLFTSMGCELVVIMSRRPSLPPGELLRQHGESIRHSGSTDYCWCVWCNGMAGTVTTRMVWAAP